MVTTESLPIALLIGLFIIYIVVHMIIGKWKNDISKMVPPDEKLLKKATMIFKWFPAIYVVFVLIVLYTV